MARTKQIKKQVRHRRSRKLPEDFNLKKSKKKNKIIIPDPINEVEKEVDPISPGAYRLMKLCIGWNENNPARMMGNKYEVNSYKNQLCLNKNDEANERLKNAVELGYIKIIETLDNWLNPLYNREENINVYSLTIEGKELLQRNYDVKIVKSTFKPHKPNWSYSSKKCINLFPENEIVQNVKNIKIDTESNSLTMPKKRGRKKKSY